MIRAGVAAFAVGLMACTPTPPPPEPPGAAAPAAETPVAGPQNAEEASAQDACGMAAFADLVGTPAADIDATSLPAGARIITPDTMVTQDFRADRLNIITGTDGTVGSLRCF